MNSSAPTAIAAARIWSSVAPGRPNAMFSRTEPAKRKPSCGTIPSCRRSDWHGDVAQVVPVDRDATAGRVVEPGEQLDDRRLARARVPDEGDRPARRDRERDAVQDLGPALGVREVNVVERHLAPDLRQLARVGGVGQPRLGVEHGEDVVERGRRRQERLVELRELLHRVEEVRQEPDEDEEAARRQVALEHQRAAVAEHHGHRERREQVDVREVDRRGDHRRGRWPRGSGR